nr:MAG: hypothetical protein [Microviridae sp.]
MRLIKAKLKNKKYLRRSQPMFHVEPKFGGGRYPKKLGLSRQSLDAQGKTAKRNVSTTSINTLDILMLIDTTVAIKNCSQNKTGGFELATVTRGMLETCGVGKKASLDDLRSLRSLEDLRAELHHGAVDFITRANRDGKLPPRKTNKII